MKLLSTGQPSTLGNWYNLCKTVFGEDAAPTKFIKEKMDELGGEDEVVTDERQLLHVLSRMYMKERRAKLDEY